MIGRLMVLLLSCGLLAGCETMNPTGSIANGECKVFERPPYALRGATRYDQDVADNFVESGVGGCRWQRPAQRPAELDASPAPKIASQVKPKPSKRGLIQRSRARLWPKTSTAPIVVPPAALDRPVADDAPPPDPPLPPPAPLRARTPLEQLLHLDPTP